jgi:hypothetical protein
MVNIDDIRNHVQNVPFEPFELRLSNGRAYTVDHPEFIALSRDGRTVAYYTDDGRLVTIALAHVNTIEKLNRPNAA